MKLAVLAGAMAFSLACSAHASIIPALTGVTQDGADFKFTYQGQLAPDQGVTSGDMLVIIDFAGFVPGTAF